MSGAHPLEQPPVDLGIECVDPVSAQERDAARRHQLAPQRFELERRLEALPTEQVHHFPERAEPWESRPLARLDGPADQGLEPTPVGKSADQQRLQGLARVEDEQLAPAQELAQRESFVLEVSQDCGAVGGRRHQDDGLALAQPRRDEVTHGAREQPLIGVEVRNVLPRGRRPESVVAGEVIAEGRPSITTRLGRTALVLRGHARWCFPGPRRTATFERGLEAYVHLILTMRSRAAAAARSALEAAAR